MKVNEKLISEISSAMKIKFTEKETVELVSELNETLQMLDTLSEVDTEGIEGSFYGRVGEASFREDEVVESPDQVKLMLRQAKESKDNFIEVPAILDDGEAGAQ